MIDKPCKKCGSFERYNTGRHACKQCSRRRGREHYKKRYVANAKRFLEKNKRYYAVNRDKIRAQRKLPAIREREKLRLRDWRQRNIEHARKQSNEWLVAHLEAHIWSRAKRGAKIRGLPFTIEVSDIHIPAVCPLLGIAIERKGTVRTDNSPSIDRIDSSLGYVKGNVWIVSWRANNIKTDATLEELELLVAGLKNVRRLRSVG